MEKIVVGAVVVFGVMLLFLRIHNVKQTLLEKEMERICRDEYNKSYSHHDSWHFWCYTPINEINLEFERIQWSEHWHRPFEVPKTNFTLNVSA
jgi:hypothetical protein